ncbi:cobalt ECF transporter T component CbiQ [Clostridium sp. P21]|uniref:Cobalt ECF transporter T component CbiQ n=1 Tax=Clostridium muellerianum TaxID=2716538 RepID=A0A7Y0EF59_9CLOT|nr:cobalt ECF transporter T component CbiQ [Clostridium muellerianum]NMM62389.1 cobalt ECF transporter T component CbiQ [Clostridium muellerianum]
MISIDKLAYISELRKANPMEKFIFSILTMILCISLNNIVYSILVILFMAAVTVFKGKIPAKSYGELILIPLVFLVIGIVTIAINTVGNSREVIFSFSIFSVKLGCTKESIFMASKIFFKALASVSCLYFLALTTPVFEILTVLRKLKAPKLFVELMGLVYRFIFVLLDTANMIFISQNSRLGYSRINTAYSSLGKLVTSLFISSYKRSQDIYTAMESRCYDGEINLIEDKFKISYKNIFIIVIIEAILVAISLSKNIFGGVI